MPAIWASCTAALAIFATTFATGAAEQTTGAPGSPHATATISGKQLPPPDPNAEAKAKAEADAQVKLQIAQMDNQTKIEVAKINGEVELLKAHITAPQQLLPEPEMQDGPGPDETMMHEQAEAPQFEQMEPMMEGPEMAGEYGQ